MQTIQYEDPVIETKEDAIIRLKRIYREKIIRAACIGLLLGLFAGIFSTTLFLGNLPMREYEVRLKQENEKLINENVDLKKITNNLINTEVMRLAVSQAIK